MLFYKKMESTNNNKANKKELEKMAKMTVSLEGEMCPCCLEQIEPTDLMVVPCGHKFHFKCGMKWFNTHQTCPNCRSDTGHGPIVTNKLMLNVDTMPEFQHCVSRYNVLLGNKYSGVLRDQAATKSSKQIEYVDDLVKNRWKSLMYLQKCDVSTQNPKAVWKTMSQKDKRNDFLNALKYIAFVHNEEMVKTTLGIMTTHQLH